MLTTQEQKILAHMACGESNDEIARACGYAPSSMKQIISRIYAELGLPRDNSFGYRAKRDRAVQLWKEAR